jgi:CDP-4-dehydro-6-deoxyglucose reductase
MIDAAKHDFATLCKLPEEEFFADAFTFATDGAL